MYNAIYYAQLKKKRKPHTTPTGKATTHHRSLRPQCSLPPPLLAFLLLHLLIPNLQKLKFILSRLAILFIHLLLKKLLLWLLKFSISFEFNNL
jgi:hypothetical protein